MKFYEKIIGIGAGTGNPVLEISFLGESGSEYFNFNKLVNSTVGFKGGYFNSISGSFTSTSGSFSTSSGSFVTYSGGFITSLGTFNYLTLSKQAIGFRITGGTTPKTLLTYGNITLGSQDEYYTHDIAIRAENADRTLTIGADVKLATTSANSILFSPTANVYSSVGLPSSGSNKAFYLSQKRDSSGGLLQPEWSEVPVLEDGHAIYYNSVAYLEGTATASSGTYNGISYSSYITVTSGMDKVKYLMVGGLYSEWASQYVLNRFSTKIVAIDPANNRIYFNTSLSGAKKFAIDPYNAVCEITLPTWARAVIARPLSWTALAVADWSEANNIRYVAANSLFLSLKDWLISDNTRTYYFTLSLPESTTTDNINYYIYKSGNKIYVKQRSETSGDLPIGMQIILVP